MGVYDTPSSQFGSLDPEAFKQILSAPVEPYTPPPPPPPEETGVISGTFKALGRGIAGIGEQAGQAMEWNPEFQSSITQNNPAGDETKLSTMNKLGRGLKEGAEKIKDSIGEPIANGFAKKAWFSGVEALPASAAYAVPAYAGAAIGAGLGIADSGGIASVPQAIAGAAVGQSISAPIMFRSAAQEHADTLRKLNPAIDSQKLIDSAVKAGHAEWMGEAVSDIPEAVIFSRLPGFKGVIKSVREGIKPTVKQLGKNMLATQAAEQLGENYTTWQQTRALNQELPENQQIPMGQALLDTVGSTAVMSSLMGLGGTGVQYARGHMIEKALSNPAADPEKRGEAAGKVYGALHEAEKEGVAPAGSADNFLKHALNAIGDVEHTGTEPYALDLTDPKLLEPFSPVQAPGTSSGESASAPAGQVVGPDRPGALAETSMLNDSSPMGDIPDFSSPAAGQQPFTLPGYNPQVQQSTTTSPGTLVNALTAGGISTTPQLEYTPIPQTATYSTAQRQGIAGPIIDAEFSPVYPALPAPPSDMEKARTWAQEQIQSGKTYLMQNRGVSNEQHDARILAEYKKAQGVNNDLSHVREEARPTQKVPSVRGGNVTRIAELEREKQKVLSDPFSRAIAGGEIYTPKATQRMSEINAEIQRLSVPDAVPSVSTSDRDPKPVKVKTIKPKSPNAAQPLNTSKDSMLVAISKLGGISRADINSHVVDSKGLAMGVNTISRRESRSFKGVIYDKGIPLDKMREALVEHGYLPQDADINDLLNKLDSSQRGVVHRSTHAGEMAAESEYDDQLARYQSMLESMTDEEHDEYHRNQWLEEQAEALAYANDVLDEFIDSLDGAEMTAADWQAVEDQFMEALNGEIGNVGTGSETDDRGNEEIGVDSAGSGANDQREVQGQDAETETGVPQPGQNVAAGEDSSDPGKESLNGDIPSHIVNAVDNPREVMTAVSLATKQQTKDTLNENLKNGGIPHSNPIRLTTVEELHDIISTGKLREGKDYEGRSGISAQLVDGKKPIVAYGPNDKISAAIIFPESSNVGKGQSTNEVKVDARTDVKDLRFVVDGFKAVMGFDELREAVKDNKKGETQSDSQPRETAQVGAGSKPALIPTAPLDQAAHEAATSPTNETPEPTLAQIEAGNYKKGHVDFQGLDISIENPAGSKRKGVDPNGKAWETELHHHYGYIKGTIGRDKDHIDVFIGDNHDSSKVFVVDQIDPGSGTFDEHKVMLGFDTLSAARSGYLKNYDKSGPQRIGAITETSLEEFKRWLKDGNTRREFTDTQREAGGRFVKTSDGGIDFGVVKESLTNENGVIYPSAPIRLEKGGDYGHQHIAEKRIQEFKDYGYADEIDALHDIASNYTEIFEQPNGRLLLVKRNGRGKYASVELEKEGDYYGVTTWFLEDANPKSKTPYENRGGRKLLLRVAHADDSGKSPSFPESGDQGQAENSRRSNQSNNIVSPAPEKVKPESKAKVTDAGEELTYNKRNRIKSGIKWVDVQDKNDALKAKEVQKGNVYPKPDYEALVSGGMEPVVAHIVKQVYDSISAKPSVRGIATDLHFQTYITAVNRVMSGVLKWANDKNAVRAWVEKQAKTAGAMMGKPTSLSDLTGVTSLYDSVYPGGWREFGNEISIVGDNKVLKALQPGYAETRRAFKDISLGWPAKTEAWQRQGFKIIPSDGFAIKEVPQGGDRGSVFFVRKSTGAGHYQYVDAAHFYSREEAQAFLDGLKPSLLFNKRNRLVDSFESHEQAVEAARNAVKKEGGGETIEERGMNVADAERTGPERREEGEDVTAEQLRDVIGFKGLNFGNWVPNDERQMHLNHAYDSFLDLADVLNLPPRALSLDGMLGLAIGAQGSGSYAAHFVPGVNEINITRTMGAGSMAHEWAHALDHYFAAQAGFAAAEAPWMTVLKRNSEKGEVRPEIIKAFSDIVQSMKQREATPEEIEARAKSLEASSRKKLESWLKYFEKEFARSETAAAEFSVLADRIRKGDYQRGEDAYVTIVPARGHSLGTSVLSIVADVRDLAKKYKIKIPTDSIKSLDSNVSFVKYLEEKKDDDHKPQMAVTRYQAAANKLDAAKKGKKLYWSTPLEMFARAFDAYITDKLKAKAQANSYLSHTDRQGDTVPMGDERTTINAAFDTLIGDLKTRETDRGIALFALATSDQMSGPSGLKATEAQAWAKTLPISKRVNIVQSVDDLPANARAEIDKAGVNPNRVQAMELHGTIHVIADNVPDLRRIKALVIGHELAHAGQSTKIVDLAVDWFKRTKDGKSEQARAAHDLLRTVARSYGFDLSSEKHFRLAVQEATAAYAEQAADGKLPTAGLIQQLFIRIKYWLRKNGLISHVSDSELSLAVSEMLRIGEKRLSTGMGGERAMFAAKQQNPSIDGLRKILAAVDQIVDGSAEATISGIRNDLKELTGTGDVTLVWGDAKKGLFHIGSKRGANVVGEVLLAIAAGNITKSVTAKKTVHLVHGNTEAVLSLDEHGLQKTWLLTGWKIGEPDAAGEVGTLTGATQIGPTFSRSDLGAGSSAIIIPYMNNLVNSTSAQFALRDQVTAVTEAIPGMIDYAKSNWVSIVNPLDFSRTARWFDNWTPDTIKAGLGWFWGNPHFEAIRDAAKKVFVDEGSDREVNRMSLMLQFFGYKPGVGDARTRFDKLKDFVTKWHSGAESTDWEKLNQRYSKMTKEQQAAMDILTVQGDVNNTYYSSYKTAMLNNKIRNAKLTEETFELYRDVYNHMKLVAKIREQQIEHMLLEAGKSKAEVAAKIADYRNETREVAGWMTRNHGEGNHVVAVHHIVKDLKFTVRDIDGEGQQAFLPFYPGKEVMAEVRRIAGEIGAKVTLTDKGAVVVTSANGEKLDTFIAEAGEIIPRIGQQRVMVYSRRHNIKGLAAKHAGLVEKDLKKYMPENYRSGEEYLTRVLQADTIPEELFQNMPNDIALEAGLEKAIEAALKHGEISSDEMEVLKSKLIQDTAEVLLGRAAGKYQIRRAPYLIEGYDTENVMSGYQDYMTGVAGMLSKAQYANRQFKHLTEAEVPVKPWAYKYVFDSLRNQGMGDRISANARAFVSLMYLALKPSSALINATQIWTLGVAEIGRIIDKGSAVVLIGKAQKDALADKLTLDERQIFDSAIMYQQEAATALSQITGHNEGTTGKWSRLLNNVTGKGMAIFQNIEVLNRKTIILAAYRVLRDKNLPAGVIDKAALKQALDINNNVNFDQGRHNLPGWARTPLGHTLYALKSFTWNNINWIYTRATSGERRDMIALLRYTGMVMLIGGASALAGGDELDKLYRKLRGKSLLLEAKEWTHKNSQKYGSLGEMASAFAWHGMAGMFGVNISNSMRLQIPVASEMLGDATLPEAIGGVWVGLAKKAWLTGVNLSRGDAYRAVESAAPEALAGGMRAYRQYDRGMTTLKGRPVFDENGQPLKYSATDAGLRAAGFQPSEQSRRMEVAMVGKELVTWWKDERDDLLAALRISKPGEDRKEVMRKVLRFNRDVRQSQAWGKVGVIDSSTITRALTYKPNKKDVAWQQEHLN